MTYYLKEITRIKDTCYQNKGQIDKVIGTRHYINNHFDKGLNLGLLSPIRFTSKFHLLRLFKKYYGQTPKEYLVEKRLEQAKEMLCKGTNISDTCYDIGFETPGSFSTLFKSTFWFYAECLSKKSNFHKVESFLILDFCNLNLKSYKNESKSNWHSGAGPRKSIEVLHREIGLFKKN